MNRAHLSSAVRPAETETPFLGLLQPCHGNSKHGIAEDMEPMGVDPPRDERGGKALRIDPHGRSGRRDAMIRNDQGRLKVGYVESEA